MEREEAKVIMDALVELRKHEISVNKMLGEHGLWVCQGNYIVKGLEALADVLQLTRRYEPFEGSMFMYVNYGGCQFTDNWEIGESNGTD